LSLGRWHTFAQQNFSAFALIGRHFADPASLPTNLVLQPNLGYDGQFYYRLALNPFDLHATAYGITVDTPYRFIRDGYPFLAWFLAAGQHDLVPVTLIAVNVLAIAAQWTLVFAVFAFVVAAALLSLRSTRVPVYMTGT
jgi:hypothetical protein